MASPIILRVCESCHQQSEPTGGLRNKSGSLYCARCVVVVELIATMTHEAYKCDGAEAAQDFAKFCALAAQSYIHRKDSEVPQSQVAILFADH